MKRCVAVIFLVAAMLAGCGGQGRHLWITHSRQHVFTACISSGCGPWSATLNWKIPAFPNTTGYYLFLNGGGTSTCNGNACYGSATSSPFTFTGSDCAATNTLGVEAHDGSGNVGPLWTTTYTSPACATNGGGGNNNGSFAFDDEFGGSAVDQTQWAVLDSPGEVDQGEPECYFPAQTTVSSSNLNLDEIHNASAVSCDNNGSDSSTGLGNYSSGAVNMSHFSFTYGTVDVSAEMAGDGSAWPAIWMLGTGCQDQTGSGAAVPGAYLTVGGWYEGGQSGNCETKVDSTATYEEQDIADAVGASASVCGVSYTQGSSYQEDSHLVGGNNVCNVSPGFNTGSAFHTYSIQWEPTYIAYSRDGSVVDCWYKTSSSQCPGSGNDHAVIGTIPSSPEFVLLDQANCQNTTSCSVNNASFPQDYKIAYVHVTVDSSFPVPLNTGAPTVSGTPTHGQVLTCGSGTWSNSPTSFTYTWMRDKTTPISGQFDSANTTYTLVSGDIGHTINCVVTGKNANGAASATSASTATVN